MITTAATIMMHTPTVNYTPHLVTVPHIMNTLMDTKPNMSLITLTTTLLNIITLTQLIMLNTSMPMVLRLTSVKVTMCTQPLTQLHIWPHTSMHTYLYMPQSTTLQFMHQCTLLQPI